MISLFLFLGWWGVKVTSGSSPALLEPEGPRKRKSPDATFAGDVSGSKEER